MHTFLAKLVKGNTKLSLYPSKINTPQKCYKSPFKVSEKELKMIHAQNYIGLYTTLKPKMKQNSLYIRENGLLPLQAPL